LRTDSGAAAVSIAQFLKMKYTAPTRQSPAQR
jgi:hypothetical protein